MILRIFIFVLLLLAGIISTATTVTADRIVLTSVQDFGPVINNKTYSAHVSSQPENRYTSTTAGKRISENLADATESLSLALSDVIKLSGNPSFGAYQFNNFLNSPSHSGTPMIIEGNYSQNSSQDAVVIDAHIRFSVPSNTYMGKMYLNAPSSLDFNDFGECTKDYQIFSYDPEDMTPIPFPAAIYLLGTGLIVLCIFARKNKTHQSPK